MIMDERETISDDQTGARLRRLAKVSCAYSQAIPQHNFIGHYARAWFLVFFFPFGWALVYTLPAQKWATVLML